MVSRIEWGCPCIEWDCRLASIGCVFRVVLLSCVLAVFVVVDACRCLPSPNSTAWPASCRASHHR